MLSLPRGVALASRSRGAPANRAAISGRRAPEGDPLFPGAYPRTTGAQRQGAAEEGGLPFSDGDGISRAMTILFDMDDRARLPWRFFGATMTVLARLG